MNNKSRRNRTQRITVAQDGTGDFTSILQAVLAVEDSRSEDEEAVIHIRPGVYEEKVFVRKQNLRLQGEDARTTVLRFGDGAKKPRPDGSGEYGTFNTATLFLAGDRITVENLTIENTAGPGSEAGQALAVYAASDRTKFCRCRLIGYQDTLFTGDVSDQLYRLMLPDYILNSKVPMIFPLTRNVFEDCFLCGDVDFLFGPNTVFFSNCEIYSRRLESEAQSYITAASTPAGQEFGYVFSHCRLTGDAAPKSVFLGRPWRDFAKTAFVECELGPHIAPVGWSNWGRPRAEANLQYLEVLCTGPGAVSHDRAPFAKILPSPDLLDYFSRENVLAGWN